MKSFRERAAVELGLKHRSDLEMWGSGRRLSGRGVPGTGTSTSKDEMPEPVGWVLATADLVWLESRDCKCRWKSVLLKKGEWQPEEFEAHSERHGSCLKCVGVHVCMRLDQSSVSRRYSTLVGRMDGWARR